MQKNMQVTAVILAAGKGTRMGSDLAKVLHPLAGVPMIRHVVRSVTDAGIHEIVVVVGHQREAVRTAITRYYPGVLYAVQEAQLGTGHAVQCALSACPETSDHVLILCGDTPLVTPAIINGVIESHLTSASDLSVLAVTVDDPTGYGRVVTGADGQVRAIVEEADADRDTRRICHVNSGIYCVRRQVLSGALSQLSCTNTQSEFYLTDIVSISSAAGFNVSAPAVSLDPIAVMGVNTPADLIRAERYFTCTRT